MFNSACRALCAVFLAAAVASPVFAQADLSRMLNLLDATPDGGWVQVNTNKFSDAWVTGPDALPSGSYSDQAAIIHAWSSFAWDSNRGNLLLWGGGHANYMGNEMYVWQGSTGLWTRGSVSSRLEQYNTSSTYFTVDNAAPQSAHTYDNNLFLPLNDLFITFGGAAFNSGGVFVNKGPSGTPVRAGPWIWDPRKADPNKVGGTTGSGYNTMTPGGQMWINQQGKWVGAEPPSYTEATSAYVQESGQDVVYVTGDSNASGWPSLYRYEPGNARAGATGRFEKVAIAWNAPGYQSTGAIDTVNRLYVRISKVSNFPSGVGVWDLTEINASDPSSVTDKLVRLALPNSSFFDPNVDYGMEFDSARGKFVLWDGHQGGTVYETQSVLDSSRNIAATWPITAVPSATAAWPTGNYQTGVLGKWRFVKELGAFVALDEFQSAAADAAVWLYKPVGWRRPGSGGEQRPAECRAHEPGERRQRCCARIVRGERERERHRRDRVAGGLLRGFDADRQRQLRAVQRDVEQCSGRELHVDRGGGGQRGCEHYIVAGSGCGECHNHSEFRQSRRGGHQRYVHCLGDRKRPHRRCYLRGCGHHDYRM